MFVWHALTNGKGVVDRPRSSQGLRDVPPKIATSALANPLLATACSIAIIRRALPRIGGENRANGLWSD
jgi:hypothetical protein